MTVAQTLAARITETRRRGPSPVARRVAEDLLLDVAGLCVAARASDYVRAVVTAEGRRGACTAFGHGGGYDDASAALINGTAAHGEDFDDTFEGGPVHAGAVIVPTVLATAERFGGDGADVLHGVTVGVETMCRLSLVAPTMVHRAGFHPTAVFGALAATAGAGATLGLMPDQLVDALGIAGSMAGGIIEYLADGSWTKRLHAGWAAQSGLRAALLARAGFVGPRTVLDGTHGLFFAFARTREANFAALTETFGDEWLMETVAFKPYACGTMIHPYIDCALRLRERGIEANDVVEIVCEVAEGTVHRLWEPLAEKQRPPNAYAAKFSTPYCMASAFFQGEAGLATFSDGAVDDERVRALAAKIRYVVDPANPYPREFTGHLRARLRNESVVELRQPYLRGGAHEPLTRAEIEAKFFANAAYGGWSRARAFEARDALRAAFDGSLRLGALRG
jgi:2-methylcitrate dehydratase PrpD